MFVNKLQDSTYFSQLNPFKNTGGGIISTTSIKSICNSQKQLYQRRGYLISVRAKNFYVFADAISLSPKCNEGWKSASEGGAYYNK